MFRLTACRFAQPLRTLDSLRLYSTVKKEANVEKGVKVSCTDYYILQKEQDKIQRLSQKAELLKKEIADLKIKIKEGKRKTPAAL